MLTIFMIDFTGLDWWTHERLVNYNQPNPAEADISNWLIQNPQRLNLANVGLQFEEDRVTENDLEDKSQDLDLWSGSISSSFVYDGSRVDVQTWSHPGDSIVAIEVKSDLLRSAKLGVFYDFPYSDVNKFDAPYVGVWNDTTHHKASVQSKTHTATFQHVLDDTANYLKTQWLSKGKISGPLRGTNKYVLRTTGSSTVRIVASFSNTDNSADKLPSFEEVTGESRSWWASYWNSGAFIDLSATKNATATELQRRIILSQYLMAVNEASDNPPQGMCSCVQPNREIFMSVHCLGS